MSAPLRLRSEWDDAARREPVAAATGVPKTPSRSDGTPDSVSSWLDVLTRMLPARQGAEVREELESHVRERVRDLVLAGTEEAAATRTAIAELGDAAAVAQRFREAARTPFRRLAMNLAVLSVAGAALVTSVVAVRGPGAAGGGAGGPTYQPGVVERVTNGPEPSVPRLEATETPLASLLDTLGRSINAETIVRWPALDERGIPADHLVTVRAAAGSLSAAFDALNAAISPNPDERAIDFRLNDGVLEVAPSSWFDRRETTLVRYDLTPIEEQGIEYEEFLALVVQFVSPDDWKNNGGDLAEHRLLGRYAFVKAPARIHDGVRWFLDQFNGKADAPGKHGAADGAGVVQVHPLQHADASETLESLKKLRSIREIDFTRWTTDSQTNSIIGQAPTHQHEWVERALRDLDTPERATENRQRSEAVVPHLMLELARRAPQQVAIQADLPLLAAQRTTLDHAVTQEWLARVRATMLVPQPTARALLLEHAPADSALGAVRALLRGVEGAQLEMYVDGNTLIVKGPSKDQVLAAEQVVWKLEELARVIKGEAAATNTAR